MQNPPVDQKQLRSLQIIHAAMLMGLIMFFMVFLLIFFTNTANPPARMSNRSGFDPLMLVNFTTLIGVMVARMIIPPIVLKQSIKQLPQGLSEEAFATAAFPGMSKSHLINLALLEGPALFSSVILIVNTNMLIHSPILWINGIPALLCMTLMAMAFPTITRHQMLIKEEYAVYCAKR